MKKRNPYTSKRLSSIPQKLKQVYRQETLMDIMLQIIIKRVISSQVTLRTIPTGTKMLFVFFVRTMDTEPVSVVANTPRT